MAGALTVVSADAAFQTLEPAPAHETDVDDGLAELARGPADILVFGSSHSRSFRPLQAEVNRRAGRARVAIVTMESGWAVSFAWVYDHRLDHALDAHPVARVVIPLTFSDVCGRNDHSNIPRNAWHLSEMVDDVLRRGLTEDARTYLTTKMNAIFARSLLVQRGANLLDRLKARVRSESENERARAANIAGIQQVHFIDTLDRCPAPDEVPALERLVARLERRGMDVTLIMFPLPPMLVRGMPPKILQIYREIMTGVAQRSGVRLLDWATLPLMTDADFMDDFDHATPAGSAKLMTWALQHDLAFLAP